MNLTTTRIELGAEAPIFIDFPSADGEARLRDLVERHRPKFILDAVEEQLEELFTAREPRVARGPGGAEKTAAFVASFFDDPARKWCSGRWAYFPWNDHLVHFLPEGMHTELRTARNRELLTADEQARVRGAHVAVAGLSLGNSATLSMVVAGVAKHLRLADYDTLSASNLNRIRRGFTDLGSKKTHVTAREIYEIDPYAQLTLFHEGVTADNVDAFLLSPKPADVLIDITDSIYPKILLRLRARQHRIPVVSALDFEDLAHVEVERFDLEPDRPLFHGTVPEEELLRIGPGATSQQYADVIIRWVSAAAPFGDRLMTSVQATLEGRLAGFPQLATTAFMAGTTTAYAVRQILLGRPVKQGSVVVSLDDAFRT